MSMACQEGIVLPESYAELLGRLGRQRRINRWFGETLDVPYSDLICDVRPIGVPGSILQIAAVVIRVWRLWNVLAKYKV